MKAIFVVGTPRSGTTFLQACLLGLEGFTSIPETHFFSALFSRRGLLSWRSKLRSALLRRRAFHSFVLPSLSLRRASSQFVEQASRYVQRGGFTGLIEKTPSHLWYVDEISREIPNSKFIHIVRSRYDVVRSMYDATNRY